MSIVLRNLNRRGRQSASIEGRYQTTKPLTTEQEIEAFTALAAGDESALETIAAANIRFVVSVAKEFGFSEIPLADLVSAGNVGLLVAARKFDVSKGYKFISYAVHWIRNHIQREMDTQTLVKIPSNTRTIRHKISKVRDDYPTTEAAADALGYSELEQLAAQTYAAKNVSFDDLTLEQFNPGDISGVHPLLRKVVHDTEATRRITDNVENKSAQELVQTQMGRLNEREKYIVTRLFGLDGKPTDTASAIARELNISRERVRQIKEDIFNKLRTGKMRKLWGEAEV